MAAVAVTGGTGRLGRVLVARLLAQRHEVPVLSRRSEPRLPAGAVARLGHYADLVLLTQNPLESIDNLDSVALVMVGGKVWRPGQLRSGIAMR